MLPFHKISFKIFFRVHNRAHGFLFFMLLLCSPLLNTAGHFHSYWGKPSLRAAPLRHFTFPWIERPEWKGQAEVARYTGKVLRYGERRLAELILITVIEPFNLKQAVKSENDKVGLWALKQNQLLSFQTGVYPYRQMNSVFWQLGQGTLIKASMTSQEWCGQSFKEARILPGHLQLTYNSYWEGEGAAYMRVPLAQPKAESKLGEEPALLYDELPLLVRSPQLKQHSNFWLFPLLMSSQVLRPDFDIGKPARRPAFVRAKFSFAKVKFKLGSKTFNEVQRISVRFPDPSATTQKKNQDLFYVHEKGANRVLLSWERHDGSRLNLQGLYYTAYWKENGLNDRLTKNQIKNLRP